MKIKSLFVILVIGIFLIPLLVIGSVMALIHYRSFSRNLVHNLEDNSVIVNDINDADIQIPDIDDDLLRYINKYVNAMPFFIDCVVIAPDGSVVYSEIPGIPQGTVFTSAHSIIPFNHRESERYIWAIDSVSEVPQRRSRISSPPEKDVPAAEMNPAPQTERKPVLFLMRVEKDETKHYPPSLKKLFFGLVGILETALLFAIIISVFIIKTIVNSVEKLKDAVQTLEAGNFDKAIKLKGNNEIMILANYLENMRRKLKDEQVRHSYFMIGLSHDLRTPITLIKGYAEAIRDGMGDDPHFLQKSLNIIEEKTTQLENMLNSIIEDMRFESSEYKGRVSDCGIKIFFQAFASKICQDGNLLGKYVFVEMMDVPDNLVLKTDEDLILRFFQNIIGNAFRYTSDDGVIKFFVSWKPNVRHKKESTAGILEIKISDNGCGIAEKDLPFIFDPFYRGTNSRREEGHGFGLSIVKHIADTYGWHIEVESKEGQGTSFTVSIYDCEYKTEAKA